MCGKYILYRYIFVFWKDVSSSAMVDRWKRGNLGGRETS